jgi:hypothetical protein
MLRQTSGTVESLAGRIEDVEMNPFDVTEVGADSSEQSGFPIIASLRVRLVFPVD